MLRHPTSAAAAPSKPPAIPKPPPLHALPVDPPAVLTRRASLFAWAAAAAAAATLAPPLPFRAPRANAASSSIPPPAQPRSAPASAPSPALIITQPIAPANINLSLAPDQSLYDPADPDLRDAASLLQEALNAPNVRQEEALWTKLIKTYSSDPTNAAADKKPWEDDVVGRALGNRGNARARQGRLDEAVADYNAAMLKAPWSVDPVLNRGVALEAANRLDEAAADYSAVLKVAPEDPSAWNNLGNTRGKQGAWREARDCFAKAAELAPRNAFAFAAAQRAVADFQLGEKERAIRDLRALLRRFADFDDARAALAAALWSEGLEAQAESEWLRVGDPRYKDLNWVRQRRAWPPALADALASFLRIETVV